MAPTSAAVSTAPETEIAPQAVATTAARFGAVAEDPLVAGAQYPSAAVAQYPSAAAEDHSAAAEDHSAAQDSSAFSKLPRENAGQALGPFRALPNVLEKLIAHVNNSTPKKTVPSRMDVDDDDGSPAHNSAPKEGQNGGLGQNGDEILVGIVHA